MTAPESGLGPWAAACEHDRPTRGDRSSYAYESQTSVHGQVTAGGGKQVAADGQVEAA